MIQRIQTLFLVLIAVAMGIMIAFPIWSKTATDGTQSVQLDALHLTHQQGITANITPVWYIALLGGVVAAIAIYTIFQYRNRMRQAVFCGINSLVMTAIVALVMYFIFKQGQPLFDAQVQGEFKIGFYALLVALLSNFFANRFIRRDEKFVRSQERMR